MKTATGLLKRHPANPLLSASDLPAAKWVFNPSPALHDGKTVLLLSVIPEIPSEATDRRANGQTYVARSEDGVHFEIEQEPFIRLSEERFPFNRFSRHIIDNRISKIDDTYYVLTPALCTGGFLCPVTVLGKTLDFRSYEPMSIIDYPQVRGTSLFPGRISGKYCKLVRIGAGSDSRGEIWLGWSPDLVHWGDYMPLLAPGFAEWSELKIGPTPPVKTEDGWLELIHGVKKCSDGNHYHIGAMLLDLEEPWKILGKTQSCIMGPEEPYELDGHVPNTVFPCGILADESTDEVRLYYGAADTCIGLATGKLSDIIQACLDEI